MRWLRGSILRKVLIPMVMASVLAGGVILGMAVWQQVTVREYDLVEANRLLAEVAVQGVETGYAINRWPDEILDQISKSADVLFLRVVKPDGEVYAVYGRDMWVDSIDDLSLGSEEVVVKDSFINGSGERIKVIVHPLHMGDGSRPWSLFLGMSLKSVVAARNKLISDSAVYFLGIIALVALLSYGLTTALTKPLGPLTEGVRSIARGELGHRIRLKTGDEIEELGEAFNHMAGELELRVGEIEEARDMMSAANKELKRLSEVKSRFLANVSHDLRTPLTSILGFSAVVLKKGKDDPQWERFVTIIHDESERLTRLVNDVLDLSKLEAGKVEWHLGDMDIAVVVNETVESMQGAAAQKGITLRVDDDAMSALVHGDADRLADVMTNLIGNAIKFTDEGEITINMIKEGSNIRVSVSDTGMGVAPEIRDSLFEPFEQVDDARLRKTRQSTGLGLAICREVVLYHGGKIWFTSELGQGSTFYFTLPVIEIS